MSRSTLVLWLWVALVITGGIGALLFPTFAPVGGLTGSIVVQALLSVVAFAMLLNVAVCIIVRWSYRVEIRFHWTCLYMIPALSLPFGGATALMPTTIRLETGNCELQWQPGGEHALALAMIVVAMVIGIVCLAWTFPKDSDDVAR